MHGCGYRHGAALVRRADGQMVQLGDLMYGLLECVDGERDVPALTEAFSAHIGRRVTPDQVVKLADKLARQGLLAGTEQAAPPRRNPLLALRWKVLVTNPAVTRRLTAPFTVLLRPWLMWPILALFAVTLYWVLVEKGVASATHQAFHSPELLLLVFGLAVVSAGFHELGHAAAAKYAGAEPGGMGMGLYMVWPAFYTDVTDTYRLPRKDRLRVDLAGLYFNAAVAVLTMGVWLVVRADALLLLVGLQVLQMVKQLSPVIRADGYHILSDATGVPDLYAHMLPTVKRLLPRHRHHPSALTGRARAIVTIWVLVIVPVILSLTLSAIILLPRLVTTAWDSGQQIAAAMPHQASHSQIIDLLAGVVRLFALALPVLGSFLVAQKIARTTGAKAHAWSRGRPPRQGLVLLGTVALVGLMAWAWWPAGQYQPVRGTENGTLAGLTQLVSAPTAVARPQPVAALPASAPVRLAPGRHLAMTMIPVGGATKRHPALFVVKGGKDQPAVAIVSPTAPAPTKTTSDLPASGGTASPATAPPAGAPASKPASAGPSVVFPFILPKGPGPGDNQALATGTKDGGVKYVVSYSLVTIKDNAPVTNTNSAYALASCKACTTVAVSFQVVLVVGTSDRILPVNIAEALNKNCPACVTTAIADQMVITLTKQPTSQLMALLTASLKRLDALKAASGSMTPSQIAAEVGAIQKQITDEINASGLAAKPVGGSGSPANAPPDTSTSSTTPAAPSGSGSTTTSTTPQSSSPTTSTGTTSTQPSTTSTTSTTPAAPSQDPSSRTTPSPTSTTSTPPPSDTTTTP